MENSLETDGNNENSAETQTCMTQTLCRVPGGRDRPRQPLWLGTDRRTVGLGASAQAGSQRSSSVPPCLQSFPGAGDDPVAPQRGLGSSLSWLGCDPVSYQLHPPQTILLCEMGSHSITVTRVPQSLPSRSWTTQLLWLLPPDT